METVFVERGQASVELLAAIPLIAVVGMLGWQLVLAGHTFWKTREAARVGARLIYVAEQRGEGASGRLHARAVSAELLAASPKRSRRVTVSEAHVVTVSARVPLIDPLRAALGEDAGPRVHASSRFAP